MAGLEKKKFRPAERMCQNANMTRMVACNRSVRLVLICMDSWTRPGNNKKWPVGVWNVAGLCDRIYHPKILFIYKYGDGRHFRIRVAGQGRLDCVPYKNGIDGIYNGEPSDYQIRQNDRWRLDGHLCPAISSSNTTRRAPTGDWSLAIIYLTF